MVYCLPDFSFKFFFRWLLLRKGNDLGSNIFQRWANHYGISGISMMNCAALVPKCCLRESFSITLLVSPFRPSVTVTVQGYSLDSKQTTTTGKFCCAVVVRKGCNFWKQKTLLRQFFQK